MLDARENPLHLTSVNHISLLCKSVENSLDFYKNVLGFFPVRRPRSFDFDGAWLFNYGIGIHLLQCEDPDTVTKKSEIINPKHNNLSFQCERNLKKMAIKYVKRLVEDGGIRWISCLIEICNFQNFPVIPLVEYAYKFQKQQH